MQMHERCCMKRKKSAARQKLALRLPKLKMSGPSIERGRTSLTVASFSPAMKGLLIPFPFLFAQAVEDHATPKALQGLQSDPNKGLARYKSTW